MNAFCVARRFFSETTIHGFRYLVDGSNWIERTIWVVLLGASFLTAGLMIQNAFVEYEENPIQTTIRTIPIQQVIFYTSVFAD